jgi:hypothetical protein
MRDGNIWAFCGGRSAQISQKARASNYAISPDGSSLALIVDEVASGPSTHPRAKLVLVDLSSQFQTNVAATEFNHLSSTCGTILGFRGGSWIATDVPTGSVMKTSFKNFFACDSHRHTLLGWNDANATSARMTIQLGGKDADVLTIFLNGGREIGVSPNGKFIAYFRENSAVTQLCTQMPGSVPACVNEEGTGEVGFDGISLSDSGAVLYTGHTGEGCFYKDMAHLSKKPSQGYSNGDECVGVYAWSSEMSHPSLVQDLARFPQWITTQTFAALLDWSAKAHW